MDERERIQAIERDGHGPNLELRNQTLLLVGLDAGGHGVVKSTEERRPGSVHPVVAGGGVGAEKGPSLMADAHQSGQRLLQPRDRIAGPREPSIRHGEDLLLQIVPQALHQLGQVVEILVEGRAAQRLR